MISVNARRPDLVSVNKKKITCQCLNLPVPWNHRVKIKKKQKLNTWTLPKS